MEQSWQQLAFGDCLDEWLADERPDDVLRNHVVNWVLGRLDDPYAGMSRVPDFENLWFGRIPGTERDHTVICCSLWIEERAKVIRCDRICSLSRPV